MWRQFRGFSWANYWGNALHRIVKLICAYELIPTSGTKTFITAHSLCSSLATILFEYGHSYSSVVMHTGHRDPRSLKYYQNLLGSESLQQQRYLIGGRSVSPFEHSRSDGASGEPFNSLESTSNRTGAGHTAPAILFWECFVSPFNPDHHMFDSSALRGSQLPFNGFIGLQHKRRDGKRHCQVLLQFIVLSTVCYLHVVLAWDWHSHWVSSLFKINKLQCNVKNLSFPHGDFEIFLRLTSNFGYHYYRIKCSKFKSYV